MKKIFSILTVLLVLVNLTGCQFESVEADTEPAEEEVIKKFTNEDCDVFYEIVESLKDSQEDYEYDGIDMNYEVEWRNGMYKVDVVISHNDHKLEMKSREFTLDEWTSGFEGEEADDVFDFWFDGNKVIYESAEVLADHYFMNE